MQIGTPKLHIGSNVRQQYTIDGHTHDLIGLVETLPKKGADPDKVRLLVYSPVNSPENLLTVGWNSGIVSQHGKENEHATFRYENE